MGKGYLIDGDSLNRISKVVRSYESNGTRPPTAKVGVSPLNPGFLAELTSTYSSGYSWKGKRCNDVQGIVDISGSATSTEIGKAFHIHGSQALQSGTMVWMFGYRLFYILGNTTVPAVTSSSITAGSTSSYGTGTCTGYGTVRNYYGAAIDSGTRVFLYIDCDVPRIIGADCPPV